MRTSFEQIINKRHIATGKGHPDIPYVIALAERETLPPAVNDKKKVLLLAIDIQNDFMEGIGSLGVPGSKGDVQRLTHWMYDNMSKLTKVMCSLDTHITDQIFHPRWWKDSNGNQPAPFTIISYDDVKNEKWVPVYEEYASFKYVQCLELLGRQPLTIWPYHCLQGTFGNQLEAEFAKMMYFHSVARQSTPVLVPKGMNPLTEMYGIIKAEYDPSGFVNMPVLNAIEDFDEIYIAGEASSHCVAASAQQILEHFADDPSIASRITILEDCTSPVPGFEQNAQDAFAELQEEYGIRVAKSTEIKL